MRCDVLDLHQSAFLIQIHKSASFAAGPIHFISSITPLSTWTILGPIPFLNTRHPTCPELPTRTSRKPSADMPQLVCFSGSHLRTVAFPPIAFTQRVQCDSSLPLPIFFRCLGPCSHFSSSSGIRFLTSLHNDTMFLFCCALRQWRGNTALITTPPVPDCLHEKILD